MPATPKGIELASAADGRSLSFDLPNKRSLVYAPKIRATSDKCRGRSSVSRARNTDSVCRKV